MPRKPTSPEGDQSAETQRPAPDFDIHEKKYTDAEIAEAIRFQANEMADEIHSLKRQVHSLRHRAEKVHSVLERLANAAEQVGLWLADVHPVGALQDNDKEMILAIFAARQILRGTQ